jgi:hypothetical protein
MINARRDYETIDQRHFLVGAAGGDYMPMRLLRIPQSRCADVSKPTE